MKMQWSTENEKLKIVRKNLFPAVVGDIMDTLGFRHQFLPPQITPLEETMILCGRAMPVLSHDVYQLPQSNLDSRVEPFGLMMRALDDLKPNEVYVCTGGSPEYALWGELMSQRAMYLGAEGAVLNGYHRDTQGILEARLPTFSLGAYAQDQGLRGRVVDFRVPISLGQTVVQPGDLLFGDRDGVCVVPKKAEEEILQEAWVKVQGENVVRDAIMQGMGAEEAFKKYGIL